MNCPKCDTTIPVIKTFRDPEEIHRLRACSCGLRMLTREQEVPMAPLTDLYRYEKALWRARKSQAK